MAPPHGGLATLSQAERKGLYIHREADEIKVALLCIMLGGVKPERFFTPVSSDVYWQVYIELTTQRTWWPFFEPHRVRQNSIGSRLERDTLNQAVEQTWKHWAKDDKFYVAFILTWDEVRYECGGVDRGWYNVFYIDLVCHRGED